MAATDFFCDECHLDLEDEEVFRHHISSIHLNIFPYQCLSCKGSGAKHKTITLELMKEHTASAHVGSGLNHAYSPFDFKCLQNELDAAIEHFRRPNENRITPEMKQQAGETQHNSVAITTSRAQCTSRMKRSNVSVGSAKRSAKKAVMKELNTDNNENFSENSLEYAQMAMISKSQEQIGDKQIQGPIAKMPKKQKTLSVTSLEFAQGPVVSKCPEQIKDHQIQDPIADVPKELKILSLEEVESIAQSVYVLDESVELTLAENETEPKKEPVIFDAKNEQKKLCRTRSLSVVPNCNKPSISQHSARKPKMVDLDFDDEDEERSPAKCKEKQIEKSRSSAKRNLFGNQDENEAGEHYDMAMDTSDPIKPLSALEQVMLKLHTSEVPEKLISRVRECKYIRRFIQNGIKKGGESSCLYISGFPGTGKTASVLKVVGELQQKAKEKKVEKFTFINVNGFELNDPKKLFCVIYSILTQNEKKDAAGTAQQKLNEMFSCADRRRLPLVLLVDELDMLLTKRQEVVSTVFNWAATCESRVNVIAISNTLDLPERTLSARLSSQLGDKRLCFQPFNVKQITDIIKYRISSCEVIGKDVIVFGARKVASLSGDLREALDLFRRAIEIALEECEEKGEDPNNAKLTLQHVYKAIPESTESVRMDMCKAFSQHEEALFRAAVIYLEKSASNTMIFYQLLDEYLSVCFNMGIKPMCSSAVYSMLLDMACAHFFVVAADPDGVEMNRKIKLGFSLSDARFCLRQMEIKT